MLYLAILFIAQLKHIRSDNLLLPASFVGLWSGQPEFSVFGPFSSDEYLFSISKTSGGDYLFENNIVYDGIDMGYQRFYVEGSGVKGGSLWYCGNLTNFGDHDEITGNDRKNGFKPLVFPSDKDHNITFCLDSESVVVMGPNNENPFMDGCSGCDCGNWTISYNADDDSLSSQLSMSGSDGHTHSKHLWTSLKRVGDAPYVEHISNYYDCDFDEGGADAVPVDRTPSVSTAAVGGGCPFLRKRKDTAALLSPSTTVIESKPASVVSYDYCYRLNRLTDYLIQWTLDSANGIIHISVSASADIYGNDTYVAVGFRPASRISSDELQAEGSGHHMNFAMQGADIVTASETGGIRTMYADLYTGPPVLDDSLKITDASVVMSDGRVTASFTRPLVGGYLLAHYNEEYSIVSPAADVLYAVGQDTEGAQEGDVGIDYHGQARGMRVINWEEPNIAFDDEWKC